MPLATPQHPHSYPPYSPDNADANRIIAALLDPQVDLLELAHDLGVSLAQIAQWTTSDAARALLDSLRALWKLRADLIANERLPVAVQSLAMIASDNACTELTRRAARNLVDFANPPPARTAPKDQPTTPAERPATSLPEQPRPGSQTDPRSSPPHSLPLQSPSARDRIDGSAPPPNSRSAPQSPASAPAPTAVSSGSRTVHTFPEAPSCTPPSPAAPSSPPPPPSPRPP